MKVSVVGLGKLGSVLAAHLAAGGHKVIGTDVDPAAIERLNSAQHQPEPGMKDLLRYGAENLSRELEPSIAVANSDMTFVIVPSPSNNDGSFSARMVGEAVEMIGRSLRSSYKRHTVVIVTTLSPGTMDNFVRPMLERTSGRVVGQWLGLAYAPQFIALGSIVQDMAYPDMVLIGANDDKTHEEVWEVMSRVVKLLPALPRLSMLEAEIVKLSVNCMVTAKISWANGIGEACAAMGADPRKVLGAVGADTRIGGKYLRAGAPFGGPCFPRDVRAMSALFERLHIPDFLMEGTEAVNTRVLDQIVSVLKECRLVAILGLSYKPNTPEWTESLGVNAAEVLANLGVEVVGYDPLATPPSVWVAPTAEDAIAHADGVLIATALPEYAALNLGSRLVVDPWGMTK